MAQNTIQYQGMEVFKAKYDIVFKEIFLGDLDLLASLLSSILDIRIRAADLVILNTELVPEYESAKLTRLDIRIKMEERHIDLEIQLENRYNIDKRSVFYLSKLYIEQMKRGMQFSELCPTIAINILDFPYLHYEEYHNHYRLKNQRTHDELTDMITIHFIELPKVDRKKSECLKDLWMKFLSAESAEALDTLAKQSPELEKAVNRLVYVSADEQVRYQMEMREKHELDYYSDLAGRFAEGRAEGEASGEKKGLAQGLAQRDADIRDIVVKMKAKNMEADDIAELTGLSASEVARYYNEKLTPGK